MEKVLGRYDDSNMCDYLKPVWETERIYDETCLILGEEGSAELLFEPAGGVIIRNLELTETYVEGKDYIVNGKKITRVKGGKLPYFEMDKYFTDKPDNDVVIIEFTDNEFGNKGKFLAFGEGRFLPSRQIAVTYDKKGEWEGEKPQKDNRINKFLSKLKTDKKLNVIFYGDSITVGANASGTEPGLFTSPFMPDYTNLVKDYLEKKYDADVTYYNKSTGGWDVKAGVEHFSERIEPIAKGNDLIVFAYGMNDTYTEVNVYSERVKKLIDSYKALNPDGEILLIAPMLPNSQTKRLGNQWVFEDALKEIAKEYTSVAVAPITSLFKYFESTGKRTRDILANNVNHPNDFGHRAYAQVILKTLLGDEFN